VGINFASDWPAYVFMILFIIFFVYIIANGNSKQNIEKIKSELKNKSDIVKLDR
jgi:hypothetical protein